MYTTKKPQQNCLTVESIHIKLVKLNSTKVREEISGGIKGRKLELGYLHPSTGEVMHRDTFVIRPDEKVELFASRFPGWYHAVSLLPLHTRFTCCCGRVCQPVVLKMQEVVA